VPKHGTTLELVLRTPDHVEPAGPRGVRHAENTTAWGLEGSEG
jgi:hypothetical protein